MDYLRGRGLSDETIRKAALGYHPGPWRAPANQWGKTTWLAQGIVIPWLIEGGLWRLTIRDERVAEGNKRYLQVSGGSNGLYLAQSLLLKRPAVVLTEGEFDALSIAQECGDLVAVVADRYHQRQPYSALDHALSAKGASARRLRCGTRQRGCRRAVVDQAPGQCPAVASPVERCQSAAP